MAVNSKKVLGTDPVALKSITVPITTAISQTNKSVFAVVPGFAGLITKILVHSSTLAGTVTVEVRTGGANYAAGRVANTAVSPTADAATVATLSTTLANRKFSATEAIRVGYTSNGSGALTNGTCTIFYRPFPMGGDS